MLRSHLTTQKLSEVMSAKPLKVSFKSASNGSFTYKGLTYYETGKVADRFSQCNSKTKHMYHAWCLHSAHKIGQTLKICLFGNLMKDHACLCNDQISQLDLVLDQFPLIHCTVVTSPPLLAATEKARHSS